MYDPLSCEFSTVNLNSRLLSKIKCEIVHCNSCWWQCNKLCKTRILEHFRKVPLSWMLFIICIPVKSILLYSAWLSFHAWAFSDSKTFSYAHKFIFPHCSRAQYWPKFCPMFCSFPGTWTGTEIPGEIKPTTEQQMQH